MLELFKHIFGICGDHWHPNVFTAIASSPFIITSVHYIKCKCGGILKHKKNCKK